MLVMDRARLSLGRRCQGNFLVDDRPRDLSMRIYRPMCWKFLSTGRGREENRVNEAFTRGAAAGAPAEIMHEQPAQSHAVSTERYRLAPLGWVFCASVSDA
jgi:hypothetical protein